MMVCFDLYTKKIGLMNNAISKTVLQSLFFGDSIYGLTKQTNTQLQLQSFGKFYHANLKTGHYNVEVMMELSTNQTTSSHIRGSGAKICTGMCCEITILLHL